MNQILSVDNSPKEKIKKEKVKKTNKTNNGPVEISNVIKFFSIAILVFGIFMIGSGSYSMFKEATTSKTSIPNIFVSAIEDKQITLKISHDKNLSEVTYQWNEEEEINVACSGSQAETKIEVPEGINTLKIKATDINDETAEFTNVYNREDDININIEPDGTNLKITANGKTQLTYMTYRWDEEEETRIDINDTVIETTIEIPKGKHTLTVIAVDENNETKTKEQEVNGVTKPKLEVTTDGSSNFIINASDEQGIKIVEFIINETEKFRINLQDALPLEERKQFEYSYPLHEGENKLEVTVYNEDDIAETFRALVNM